MPNAFDIFGVQIDADDETIRKRYLELVRLYPPETHGEKFSALRAAYDKIRTLEARAEYLLDGLEEDETIEAIIEDALCSTKRPRPSLTQLVKVAFNPNPNG